MIISNMFNVIIIAGVMTVASAHFLPNGCPKLMYYQYRMPHDTDCSKFYQCNFGRPVERKCLPGKYFDSVHRVCKSISKVICAPGTQIITTDAPTTSEPDETTTSYYEEEYYEQETSPNYYEQETLPDVTTLKYSTQENPTDFYVYLCKYYRGNYYISHQDLCATYYLCKNGEFLQLTCGTGNEFDPLLKTCVPIAEGGCTLTHDSGAQKTTTDPKESTAEYNTSPNYYEQETSTDYYEQETLPDYYEQDTSSKYYEQETSSEYYSEKSSPNYSLRRDTTTPLTNTMAPIKSSQVVLKEISNIKRLLSNLPTLLEIKHMIKDELTEHKSNCTGVKFNNSDTLLLQLGKKLSSADLPKTEGLNANDEHVRVNNVVINF